MQNSVEIFSIALGLVEPWYVKEVVFDKERLQLDVYLGACCTTQIYKKLV